MVTPASQSRGRTVPGHALGLLAFLPVGIAGGIICLLVTTNISGHRPGGFAARGRACLMNFFLIPTLIAGAMIHLVLTGPDRQRA